MHCKDQNPNTGITRLAIALGPGNGQSRVILVQLEPGQGDGEEDEDEDRNDDRGLRAAVAQACGQRDGTLGEVVLDERVLLDRVAHLGRFVEGQDPGLCPVTDTALGWVGLAR